ncbi:LOW QUALITY PROTEIN: gametocyte-specific factor 1-like [Ursus maritimus]|uniref:LOW QUALITY PROTEIN: gametocyte-specific factor 1-like n=1 Tax=Ursus maritimus TaxID=29073 RepID=A0A8M1GXL5_URSMA|nr:LOW QUALITY PROTEIN: gametocyte-specific factor 1-like [Ursus maritimus]
MCRLHIEARMVREAASWKEVKHEQTIQRKFLSEGLLERVNPGMVIIGYNRRRLATGGNLKQIVRSLRHSLDPEKLLQCLYDENHQIRAGSFPYHLIKYRKNHPDVESKMATCSFSAYHQVSLAEISHPISSCDDKSCVEQDVANQTRNVRQETVAESPWQCPPWDEDWNKDLWEQMSTPFVWGTVNYRGSNSPASNIVMEHKSNLVSGMQGPKSLLYVLPWRNIGNAQQWRIYLIKSRP